VRGSGATASGPLYQSWFGLYKNLAPGVTFSYASVGSGQGIREFIGGQTDWGTSEAASAEGRVVAAVPDALHIPLAIGAVVPSYNLPGVTNLRFSATSLAGIYLGTITNWNDPAIAADNINTVLPNTPIVPLYRSDGSGATAILTDFLSSANDSWKQQVGSGTSVRWPTGWGVAGNAAMASAISRTRGALGYLAPGFAIANRLPVSAVLNPAGVYVAPTPQNLAAAADGVEYPDSLVTSIVNAPGANAYPLAGFTYALVRGSSASNVTKMMALTDFLYWSLTQGGGRLAQQGYAPLPNDLRRLAIAQLRAVVVNGRRVFDGPVT
jgi:phosphate transport system substrate-binding protein